MLDDIEKRIYSSNLNEHLGNNKPINYIKPLVTVDVITYQHAGYIKDCLDGILMQKTTFPFEVVIGEDESRDGTREICIDYAEKYPDTIRLFLRERKDVIYWSGFPTGEFNILANMAVSRGKYVAFCEGDDYWTDPYKLQKQFEYMEQNPGCTLCTHAAYVIDNQGNKIKDKRPSIGDAKHTIKHAIAGGNREATSSFFYLRSILYSYSWESQSTLAPIYDTPFYIMFAYKGYIGYIDQFMSVYRKGAESSFNSYLKKDINRAINAIIGKMQMYEFFNEFSEFKYDRIISKRQLHYIKKYINLRSGNDIQQINIISGIIYRLSLIYKIKANYLFKIYLPLTMFINLLRTPAKD